MSDKNRKVYSPDITPYSFDGRGGLFKTISYVIVSPIRLVSRVMHNIFVMPANIQDEYSEGLLVVSSLTAVLGLVDFYMNNKWALLVSQVPLIPLSILLRRSALKSKSIANEKRTIEFDTQQISSVANSVYDELNNIMEE